MNNGNFALTKLSCTFCDKNIELDRGYFNDKNKYKNGKKAVCVCCRDCSNVVLGTSVEEYSKRNKKEKELC